MNEIKLGELIDGTAQRDAIHIAVAPVVAGEKLKPGDRIALKDDGKTVVKSDDSIGIIDPFLMSPVGIGQWCYVLLMPNSITSLRHEWTHQAFATEKPTPATVEHQPREPSWRTPNVVGICKAIIGSSRDDDGNKDLSDLPILADALEEAGYQDQDDIALLRDIYREEIKAMRIVCLLHGGEFAESVKWIERYADKCDHVYSRFMVAAQNYAQYEETTFLGFQTPEAACDTTEFWRHYEIVTGTKVADNEATFFRCAC